MAIGDAAGAQGLKTYSDALLVKDVDDALNQRGDDIAATMTRLDTLERETSGPAFIVKRSSNGQRISAETWTQLTSAAWGKPILNEGFTWSGASLTIPRAGIYEVAAHIMWRNDDYRTASIQVTRNSTSTDTAATIAGNEITVTMPDLNDQLQLGVTASGKVPLNAGDVLRVFTLQRNRNGDALIFGHRQFDLTLEVVWFRELQA